MLKPTAIVRVDDVDQEIESLGDGSVSIPINATNKLAHLFPLPKPNTTQKFKQCPMFHKLLTDVLMLDKLHITRLEVIGFVTPAIIANRSGITPRDMAHAHASLGAEHLFTPEFEGSNARSLTFAQGQVMEGGFHLAKAKKPKLSWKKLSQ